MLEGEEISTVKETGEPTPIPPGGAAVNEFFSWLLDARAYSPATLVTYRSALRDFERRARVTDYRAITIRDLDRYVGRLALEGFSENTQRSRAHALKSLFRFLFSRGHLASNPAANLCQPRERLRQVVPVFTSQEIERLVFNFVEPALVRGIREPAYFFKRRLQIHRLKELRDSALLAVSYTLGLRAGEPGLLRRADYLLTIRGAALVLRESKASSEPKRYRLDRRVQAAMEAYLAEFVKQRAPSTALFPGLSFRLSAGDHGITSQDVGEVLKHRLRVTGIDVWAAGSSKRTFHAFRYSIATHLHREGRGLSLPQIQSHMRHRSPTTTFRYIHLGSWSAIQKAAIAHLYWNCRLTTYDGAGSDPAAG